MKTKIFFLIAIVAFAITGAAMFVNASNDRQESSASANSTIEK